MYSWDGHHETESRKSKAGFPDLVLWHTGDSRLIFAELKTDKGRLTVRQKAVMKALSYISQVTGFETYIWRPKQWDLIVRILKTIN